MVDTGRSFEGPYRFHHQVGESPLKIRSRGTILQGTTSRKTVKVTGELCQSELGSQLRKMSNSMYWNQAEVIYISGLGQGLLVGQSDTKVAKELLVVILHSSLLEPRFEYLVANGRGKTFGCRATRGA